MDDHIKKLMESAPPLCSALLDQGHSAGGDPIGHKCCSVATENFWIAGFYWPVCPSCGQLCREISERVTLPTWAARLGDG